MITFFVNGASIGTMPYDFEVNECPDGTRLEVGDGWQSGHGRSWQGKMKRFVVYSDAKSADQAAALFAATGDRLPVLLLDATNANSYPGSGRSWMNIVGMDGEAQHVANFETAPGFSEGAIIFDGTTRADIDITDKSIGFHYRDSWTIEMLLNPAEHQATYAGLFGDHDCLGYTGMVMQQNADNANEYLFGTVPTHCRAVVTRVCSR